MNTSNQNILIYDGRCNFCIGQVERLKKISGTSFAAESFQDNPKLFERFPKLSYDECMKEIKLVRSNGEILGGAQAIFYTLGFNPLLRPLRWLYLIPGIQQIMNWGYQTVAKNRYKIQGKSCPSGTCDIHLKK